MTISQSDAMLPITGIPVDPNASVSAAGRLLVDIGTGGGGGSGGTVTQGTAAALAGAWPVLLTDGTRSTGLNFNGSVNALVSPDQVATAAGTTGSPFAQSTTSAAFTVSNAKAAATTMGRRGLIIANNSSGGYLYLNYAATASLTAWCYRVPPMTSWTMPEPVYSGVVSGIWDVTTGAGTAIVTELT